MFWMVLSTKLSSLLTEKPRLNWIWLLGLPPHIVLTTLVTIHSFQRPLEFLGPRHHRNFHPDLRSPCGDVILPVRGSQPNLGCSQSPVRLQCHAAVAEGSGKHFGVGTEHWSGADRVVQDRWSCHGHILAVFCGGAGVFGSYNQSHRSGKVVQLVRSERRWNVVCVRCMNCSCVSGIRSGINSLYSLFEALNEWINEWMNESIN